MVHTVKVKREDIPKELQMLLKNGKDSNGEEVFSHMPEDLIYLAALAASIDAFKASRFV